VREAKAEEEGSSPENERTGMRGLDFVVGGGQKIDRLLAKGCDCDQGFWGEPIMSIEKRGGSDLTELERAGVSNPVPFFFLTPKVNDNDNDKEKKSSRDTNNKAFIASSPPAAAASFFSFHCSWWNGQRAPRGHNRQQTHKEKDMQCVDLMGWLMGAESFVVFTTPHCHVAPTTNVLYNYNNKRRVRPFGQPG
jgi:hypothetical protein